MKTCVENLCAGCGFVFSDGDPAIYAVRARLWSTPGKYGESRSSSPIPAGQVRVSLTGGGRKRVYHVACYEGK